MNLTKNQRGNKIVQSKKELLKNLLLENKSLLQCPICKNNLEIKKIYTK